jgi:Flp pilus assembly protein TadB
MLAFISVFCLVVGTGMYFRSHREQKIDWITQNDPSLSKKQRGKKKISNFELMIRQSGLDVKPYQLILIGMGLFAVLFLLVSFIFKSSLYGLLAACGSVFVIRAIIKRNIRQRSQMMSEQLVATLRMKANAIRGGAHIQQAMENIVDQLEIPLKDEYTQILNDIHGSLSVAQAFREAGTRIPVPEFQNVVMAVEIGMAAGADLPKSFDSAALMIEKRRELKEKVLAQTAGIRGQGKMIVGLVVVVFFISRFAFAEAYNVALDKPSGKFLLFLSMSMIIATLLYMRNKVKNIEI